MEAPAMHPDQAKAQDPALLEQGRYLVELIGCPVCHTDGAIIGEPDLDYWLAGSNIGIAYSNPMKYDNPGVVFASNLTPDPKTGIGRWSDDQIVQAIRDGLGRHGRGLVQVMPWLIYESISDADMRAIVAYLRSLTPIEHEVPSRVPPGSRTDELFVHFGVYRSRR
jgi:mono/diheme cytochrome c family protein